VKVPGLPVRCVWEVVTVPVYSKVGWLKTSACGTDVCSVYFQLGVCVVKNFITTSPLRPVTHIHSLTNTHRSSTTALTCLALKLIQVFFVSQFLPQLLPQLSLSSPPPPPTS
jgi:hypothetical protein